jgi:hypothetical protein
VLEALHVVHAVWTAWIPQEDLNGEGTLTFRMTVCGLLADFGVVGCAFVATLVIGLAGLALFRIHRVRSA